MSLELDYRDQQWSSLKYVCLWLSQNLTSVKKMLSDIKIPVILKTLVDN